MAVRSRSSRRVSVSVRPEDRDENPFTFTQDKRPRLHAPAASSAGTTPRRTHRRRKSSPDLLDTTTPHVPRRTSTRLVSSTPPLVHGRVLPRHATPTTASTPPITNYFLPAGTRESPDPLDTISPATVTQSKRLSGHPPPRVALAPPDSSTAKLRGDERARARSPADNTIPARSIPEPAPTAATPKPAVPEQRRSLRSHDGGSRARSELALYFPNYEQLLSFEPPKPEFLTASTTLRLIDDLAESPFISLSSNSNTDRPFGNPLLNLHNCETITLDTPNARPPPRHTNTADKDEPSVADPLNEALYFKAHRRHERQEKQLRNIERDRAQHEKQQLDRLLDELQGNDWPRVMGVGTLNDLEERKHYESKRDLFVREISALIQKFKIWKEEEKRRKVEKEKLALLSLEQQQEQQALHNSNSAKPPKKRRHSRPSVIKDSDADPDSADDNDDDAGLTTPSAALSEPPSDTDPPDLNDDDALASRQLLHEAQSATTATPPSGKKSKPHPKSKPKPNTNPPRKKKPSSSSSLPHEQPDHPQPHPHSQPRQHHHQHHHQQQNHTHIHTNPTPRPPTPPPAPDPSKPFTSFYAKPHLRETALSAHRKGRVRFAFGHPIPDLEEREFELPSEILTAEAIDACRRKRRRVKRGSRSGEEVWGLEV